MIMELEKFIGIWENKAGKRLEIKRKDKKSLSVSFYSHVRTPVIREYFKNSETIDMHAELDYYGSSIEVELWEKGKGFHLCLLYDFINLRDEPGYYLAPGLSRYQEDQFLDRYYYLFEPLDYYKKIE
jgi:hypothetical protein